MNGNFITETDHQKHTIKKYEFRSMDKKLEAEIAPAMEESGIYTPPSEGNSENFAILQELLKEVLSENSQIKTQLQSLQAQFQAFEQNQQGQIQEEIKKNAYEQGVLDGENRAKDINFIVDGKKTELEMIAKYFERIKNIINNKPNG